MLMSVGYKRSGMIETWLLFLKVEYQFKACALQTAWHVRYPEEFQVNKITLDYLQWSMVREEWTGNKDQYSKKYGALN